MRGSGFRVPALPAPAASVGCRGWPTESLHGGGERSPLWRSILDAESAVAAAHRTFLRVAHDSADLIAKHAAYELELIERVHDGEELPTIAADHRGELARAAVVLDRRACLEFAVGSAHGAGTGVCGRRRFSDAGSSAR